METLSQETYAIPVYSFENTEDWTGEANRPDETTTDSITVRLQEQQTGPPLITAVVKHNGNRSDSYTFRVTDAELNQCAYTGDDPGTVPVPVLHAVHDFGYGITNIVTYGDWYSERWEAQLAFAQLLEIEAELNDPLLKEMTKSATYLLDVLDTILLVRYGTTDDEFTELVQSYDSERSTPQPGVLDIAPLKNHFWDAAQQNDLQHLIGDEDGSKHLNIGIALNEYTTENGEYVTVTLATDKGIERFIFQKQGENTCAFVGQTHSNQVNPQVISVLQDEGYTVVNVQSVVTAETPTETAEYALLFVERLRDHQSFIPDTNSESLEHLLEATYDRLFTLFQLFATREYNVDQYQAKAKIVRNHLGVTPEEIETISKDNLTELLIATLDLMDDLAEKQAQNRIKQSPAYTEQLAEETGSFEF